MKPYKCPICDGRGEVPAGFYSDRDETKCRSCCGNGVILCPHNDPPMGAPVVGDMPPLRWKWNPTDLKMRGGCLTVKPDPNVFVWW